MDRDSTSLSRMMEDELVLWDRVDRQDRHLPLIQRTPVRLEEEGVLRFHAPCSNAGKGIWLTAAVDPMAAYLSGLRPVGTERLLPAAPD